LTGKRIVTTGKGPMNRIEIAKIIQAKGDIFQDTVTHITDIVLTDDLKRDSNKIKIARLYNIRIMTYDQYFGLNSTNSSTSTPSSIPPTNSIGVTNTSDINSQNELLSSLISSESPKPAPVKPDQKILIYKMKQNFKEIYDGEWNYLEIKFNQVGNQIQIYDTEDEFNRLFAMNLIKELITMFKNSQLDHRAFNVDGMKKSPYWMPLIKIVMALRIDELKQCKIVQIGKKYDISDLRKSYIGDVIAENLFQRKHILTGADYAILLQQIKKLNVAPPLTIRPTTTEIFFAENENQ
jgi:hypothetical protein